MAVVVAEEPLENPITHVEIDMHRWYARVIVTFMSGKEREVVIGTIPGDGLGTYDSVREWEDVTQ